LLLLSDVRVRGALGLAADGGVLARIGPLPGFPPVFVPLALPGLESGVVLYTSSRLFWFLTTACFSSLAASLPDTFPDPSATGAARDVFEPDFTAGVSALAFFADFVTVAFIALVLKECRRIASNGFYSATARLLMAKMLALA
jgi:hypothetical protein